MKLEQFQAQPNADLAVQQLRSAATQLIGLGSKIAGG
jgi:hypothetical protein